MCFRIYSLFFIFNHSIVRRTIDATTKLRSKARMRGTANWEIVLSVWQNVKVGFLFWGKLILLFFIFNRLSVCDFRGQSLNIR